MDGLVAAILDEEDEPLGDPWAETMGLPNVGRSKTPLVDLLVAETSQVMGRASDEVLTDDDKLEEALRRAVRQVSVEEVGKKPEVTVVISRLA